MFKRAVILAGGKGTRLKPYTISLPKRLVPIGDMPILEIIIRKLSKSGFDHITITVNHMAISFVPILMMGANGELKLIIR